MAKSMLLSLLLALIAPDTQPEPECASAPDAICCKTCKKGKACGDTCIAKDDVCDKPKGCACNAPE